LRLIEIQGQDLPAASPLQGPPTVVLVGHIVFQRREEKGPEMAPAPIEGLQVVLVEKLGEESLREVFAGFDVVPLASDEGVEGFPVDLDELLKRLPALEGTGVLGPQD